MHTKNFQTFTFEATSSASISSMSWLQFKNVFTTPTSLCTTAKSRLAIARMMCDIRFQRIDLKAVGAVEATWLCEGSKLSIFFFLKIKGCIDIFFLSDRVEQSSHQRLRSNLDNRQPPRFYSLVQDNQEELFVVVTTLENRVTTSHRQER